MGTGSRLSYKFNFSFKNRFSLFTPKVVIAQLRRLSNFKIRITFVLEFKNIFNLESCD